MEDEVRKGVEERGKCERVSEGAEEKKKSRKGKRMPLNNKSVHSSMVAISPEIMVIKARRTP